MPRRLFEVKGGGRNAESWHIRQNAGVIGRTHVYDLT